MIALGPKSSFSRLSQIESYSSGPTASVVDDLPGRKVKRLLRAGLEPATIGGSRCPFRECSPSTLYQLSYPGDWGKSILLGGRLVLLISRRSRSEQTMILFAPEEIQRIHGYKIALVVPLDLVPEDALADLNGWNRP